jgi:flagellar biogenesis protein FliO
VPTGGVLRVIGRTSLSPRHTVYLLAAGDRVLVVGTGPQGAPALLGELTDPDELERVAPIAESTPASVPAPAPAPQNVVVIGRPPAGGRR